MSAGPHQSLENWTAQIRRAISEPDPVLGNLLITQAHDDLSRALRDAIGADAGANFHTWAVWGSKKAGETIRFEDTRAFRQQVFAVSLVGAMAAFAVGALGTSPLTITAGMIVAAAIALVPSWLVRRRLEATRSAVLHGNRIVLEDIGDVTARYLAGCSGGRDADREFECFAGALRAGRTERGGQSMLKRAFSYYEAARRETDLDRRHEAMLMANCYAILHEHLRLQPYLKAAMPVGWRRTLTANDLTFRLGPGALCVGADLPPIDGHAFPATLREIELPELIAFLQGFDGWDRTPDSVAGSLARDWSKLEDRMNFIVDLFRSRHLTAEVWADPFTPEQSAAIRAGRVPGGL